MAGVAPPQLGLASLVALAAALLMISLEVGPLGQLALVQKSAV